MHIAVGSDHRGFTLKQKLLEQLREMGHTIDDEGTCDTESVDYPDIACVVAKKVSDGEVERGILICGTGIGMAITANKFPGVRAAAISDDVSAELSRRHNDLNVLCIGGNSIGEALLRRIVEIWLTTKFEGGRHERRVKKIAELESEAARSRCGS